MGRFLKRGASTMRRTRSILLGLAAATIAACSSGPSPARSPSPSPSDESGFVLRATVSQALPPESTFQWLPSLLVTTDRRVILPGPVRELFPGPQVPPLVARTITEAGWLAIVNAARTAGLLSGAVDFTGGSLLPGAQAARLEIVVDGRTYDLTGDPDKVPRCGEARCLNPDPGTPGAFAAFWQQLGNLGTWIGPELGREGPYDAGAYALLVGPPPEDGGVGRDPIDWPLSVSLAELARPLAGDATRGCALVAGVDAKALRPSLEAATEITPWRDRGPVERLFGLVVRPVLPGEADPCAPLVGG
jgi:hypothetical protein